MLKKISLAVLTSLLLTSVSFAEDAESVKIVSLQESPITFADVAKVSIAWSKGNQLLYTYMMNSLNDEAIGSVLKALPELSENKVALISVSMGLVLLLNETDLEFNEAMMHLATHKDLVEKSSLTLREVADALQSYSI